MRRILPILIVATALLNSCGQEHKSTTIKVSKKLTESKPFIDTENQTQINLIDQKNVDTKLLYVDDNDQSLLIENSYPRGGLNYTDSLGQEFVYAVFWTRITNNTSESLQLTMKFLEKSYQLPSSPDRTFKFLIPSDTLTLEKEILTNYGLDLNKYIQSSPHTPSKLIRTIKPNDSSGFYVVTLFNQGVNGTLRCGLKISEGKLSYRVNEMTIDCGEINLKHFKLEQKGQYTRKDKIEFLRPIANLALTQKSQEYN